MNRARSDEDEETPVGLQRLRHGHEHGTAKQRRRSRRGECRRHENGGVIGDDPSHRCKLSSFLCFIVINNVNEQDASTVLTKSGKSDASRQKYGDKAFE